MSKKRNKDPLRTIEHLPRPGADARPLSKCPFVPTMSLVPRLPGESANRFFDSTRPGSTVDRDRFRAHPAGAAITRDALDGKCKVVYSFIRN